MASGLSTAERNRYLTVNYKTATIYGALCDADPTDAAVMSGKEIAAGTDYARTEITCGDDSTTGSIANTAALEFLPANGGDWGTIGWLAICTTDVEDADTVIASGSLTVSKLIEDGDQLVFAIGAVTVAIAVQA